MTHQPFFLINSRAPQILLPYLFLAIPEVSFFFLYSFFFVLIYFFFPCSHMAAPSHHSPPSLIENHRYPSLRRNQTLTKVLASVVGKYICLFSVIGIFNGDMVCFSFTSMFSNMIVKAEICGL